MDEIKWILPSDITFTNGTRVFTINNLSNQYGLDITDLSRLLYVYNETQKIMYYAPEGSVSLVTVSETNANEFTIDSSFAVLATGDVLKIKIVIPNQALLSASNALKVAEIDPAKTWYDTVQTLNTNTVFTTSWTVLGSPSEITMEGYNVLTLFVKSEKNIASTNLRYRFIGRHTAGGAEEFPIAATVLSDGDIVSGRDATTGARYYELNDDAILVQWDMFQIKTGNGISTIEVEQQCESYTATTRSTIYYTKSYNNN